jgi:Family of unknown function (DUF6221)
VRGWTGDHMTTIVDFLEARLAEDEYSAMHSGALPVPEASYDQRTLREVASKQRIVQRYRDAPVGDVAPLLENLRDLASVFAAHPDYDPAWRPLDDNPRQVDLRPGPDVATAGSARRLPASPVIRPA